MIIGRIFFGSKDETECILRKFIFLLLYKSSFTEEVENKIGYWLFSVWQAQTLFMSLYPLVRHIHENTETC